VESSHARLLHSQSSTARLYRRQRHGRGHGRPPQQRQSDDLAGTFRRFTGHHHLRAARLPHHAQPGRGARHHRALALDRRQLPRGIQTIFGGNITLYTELCEQAREETCRDLIKHARQLGANAIIGMRYDATDVMTGLTEVLCYGTAVG
jgi:glycerol-3-phosphate dehydrogenase